MIDKSAFSPTNGWLQILTAEATRILDAGCGPQGADWWKFKPESTAMIAVDLYFQPASLPPNTQFVHSDVTDYCAATNVAGSFDLVVADHLLEHMAHPEQAASGFNHVLRTGGMIHVGVPDVSNFTDRFYRLICADGGGHISRFTLESLIEMMRQAGFECMAYRPWGDDWGWFRYLYDWKARGIQYTSQDDINYIADVFFKELTVEKGYYYGWEAVFIKREDREMTPIHKGSAPEPSLHAIPVNPISLPSARPDIPPLNDDEIIELRWISQKTRRFKRSRLYQGVKKIFKGSG
jgi:SAM-dependent methyltransferase